MVKAAGKNIIYIFLLFSVSHLYLSSPVIAQQNYLKKEISIQAKNIPLKKAIELISNSGGFKISYNARSINGDSLISIDYREQTVEKTLDGLFNKNMEYHIVGNHLVLISKQSAQKKADQKDGYIVKGYIINRKTGKKVVSAIVYDIEGQKTALTNAEGYYELEIPSNTEFRSLSCSREGYLDTIIIVKPLDEKDRNVLLNPAYIPPENLPAKGAIQFENKIDEISLINWVIPEEFKSTAMNLDIYETRPAQISFLPNAGSNGKLSGALINNFSLNVLAGYSDGVAGCEIGGILNINRSYANGLQIAGFGNFVGKYMNGVQIGGFINKNTGSINGLQIAGFNNVVLDTITGLQLAGFSNVLKGKMKGLQIAGFHNHTTCDVDGIQIAGFMNTTKKDVVLMQIGGFYNYCRNVSGLQIAGFINITDTVKKGIQIAGFLNLSKYVNACQIGVINICDSTSGISIGVYNHIKDGYRAIDFIADEVFPTNLQYRAGTKKFYNIYHLGVSPGNPEMWTVGMGLGSIFRISKKFSFQPELLSCQVNETRAWEKEMNLRSRLFTAFELKISKRMSLIAGPSLNVHVSAITNPETGEFSSTIAPDPYYRHEYKKNRIQIWGGYNTSLRYVISKNSSDAI